VEFQVSDLLNKDKVVFIVLKILFNAYKTIIIENKNKSFITIKI